jgi:hypothetical protein
MWLFKWKKKEKDGVGVVGVSKLDRERRRQIRISNSARSGKREGKGGMNG